MKLAACFLTLLPGFAVAASWTSPGFPAFSEQGTGTFVSHAQLPKGTRPLTLNFDQQCWQPADAIKLNQMLSLQPCSNTPPQWRLFRDGEYTLQLDTRSGTPTLMISIQNAVEPVASLVRECPKWDGLPLTLDVSATFPEGDRSPGLLQPANCDSEERSNNVTTRCHQQRFTPAGTGRN